MARALFDRFEFLGLHIIKTSKGPLVNIVFPVTKKINLRRASILSLSGGRTTWKIQTNPVWNDTYLNEPILPEVSSLLLTPTKFTQWPSPRVPPLIEKIGDREALVTFFGYENWDAYFCGDVKQR